MLMLKLEKSNKLEIGDNVVEIIVTAEDNITKKKVYSYSP